MTLISYDDFMEKVEENYLRSAEMAMEDDYGMIDGIINNGKKQEPEERQSVLEQLRTAEAPQPPELPVKAPSRDEPERCW